jgi:O-antigen/teichoic acid export membrane protein
MKDNQSSYKQIIKSTSIFGGVQFVNIIIAVVRSKFVAIYLGPSGMGIVGLLTNTTSLIASITNLGLGTSAVKNIAEADSSGDKNKISMVIAVFRRLVWITGLLGSGVVFVMSSWLSEVTFGNNKFTAAFMWLSVTLLLNQLSSGQMVVLQGLRQIKLLAKSNLVGSFAGLIISIPIYYQYGKEGIVPVLIFTSLFGFILSYYFSSKINIDKALITFKDITTEGRTMLAMGFLISLTGIMDQFIAYVTRIYISNQGNIEIVGLYSSGFTIINTYVGMIFTAMLTDYYPRLASASDNNIKSKEIINEQAEIAILILAPLVIGFLFMIKYLILLMYSKEFLAIDKMIYWAMLGMLFKVINWSVGIIVLARGESKKYFVIYIAALLIILATNIGGYYFYGLEGLGIAFLLSNFLLAIIGYFVARYYYFYSFSPSVIKIFLVQFFLCFVTFTIVRINLGFLNYIFGVFLFSSSLLFSWIELNKRMEVRTILIKAKNKFILKNGNK